MKVDEIYNNLDKKGKILLFVAFGFLLLATMDRMVLGPIFSQINILEAEIQAKKETLSRNLRILSFKDSILREYNKYQNYFDSGEKAQEVIIRDLLQKIENLAKRNQVNISNIQSGEVEENPVFQEFKTTVECNGALGSILRFMNMLEESDFLFQITRYELNPKSKGSDIIKASMDMSRILITAEKGIDATLPVGESFEDDGDVLQETTELILDEDEGSVFETEADLGPEVIPLEDAALEEAELFDTTLEEIPIEI